MQSNWDSLSESYEQFQIKEDSLDSLVEYPAQLELLGDIKGKAILDIACGSGRKAFEWANSGASEVYGFDISLPFVNFWKTHSKPDNLSFFQGNLSSISSIEELKESKFDIVTCLQAISYSENINKTLADIHQLLVKNGHFILTIAHPFRYVIEKMERDKVNPADAYRDEMQYTYPSNWDKSVTVSHSTYMISTIINSLLNNNFQIEKVVEPDLNEEQKSKYPQKYDWMKNYFGIMGFRCKSI